MTQTPLDPGRLQAAAGVACILVATLEEIEQLHDRVAEALAALHALDPRLAEALAEAPGEPEASPAPQLRVGGCLLVDDPEHGLVVARGADAQSPPWAPDGSSPVAHGGAA